MQNPRKYFVAIVLPEPYRSQVEAIKQELFRDYGLKGALRCPAHLTLHRPFVWEETKEEKLIEVLNQFKFGEYINLWLSNFSTFPPRVVFIDVKPDIRLRELHHALVRHLKRSLNLFNEDEDLRGFHPHITIASRDLKKNLFPELKEKFNRRSFDARFQVESICLLKLHKTWEVLRESAI